MNKIQLMDIKRQHDKYSDEIEHAVVNVLRSGIYIGGEEVSRFEDEFATYQGAKYGISCGNGTDAIVIALRALGIGAGDEVITVSWTFFATVEGISAVGAKPVFVDVEEDFYCIDTSLIEEKITQNTKAILAVHFYGQCCNMDELRNICKKRGLYLITDCAQSTGTMYKNSRGNCLGDVSCFSFFPTKILGCDGDGGMILTDDEEIARVCRTLKVHGSGTDGLWALKREYELNGKPFPANIIEGDNKYFNYLIGYNSRLDSVQAAVLRCKLIHLDEFVDERRKNAQFYNERLRNTNYILPKERENGFHSYYVYVLRHEKANIVMSKLREHGIACGTYYPVPIHMQGAYAQLGYEANHLPVTLSLSRDSFAIPVFPELNDEERTYIVENLIKIDKEISK